MQNYKGIQAKPLGIARYITLQNDNIDREVKSDFVVHPDRKSLK